MATAKALGKLNVRFSVKAAGGLGFKVLISGSILFLFCDPFALLKSYTVGAILDVQAGGRSLLTLHS